MPFDLYITSPAGRTVRALRGPYLTREDTRRTVRAVVVDAGHGRPDPVRAGQFADSVIHATPGTTVRDDVTGVAFRTEEI